ncbi:MAG TPA: hypothetical protein VFF88_09975 [Methylocella sp.]|nr:hypothetical protein [Methylocella sp.]
MGLWKVTFYLEPGLSLGASQNICFLANGTWYSTTFSNWKGDWFQKGDRLRWYGRTSSLGTAEFGQFIANRSFGGEFAHFRASSSTPPLTSSRGNYYGVFSSTSCPPPAAPSVTTKSGDPAGQ